MNADILQRAKLPLFVIGLLLLVSFAPPVAGAAEIPACEAAKGVPKDFRGVANGLLTATSSFTQTLHAQQAVYVEIKNQNILGAPVALRIRGAKRLDGNGAREPICAVDLIVLPKTTAVLWTAVFGERIEYEIDARLKDGVDAGVVTVKVWVPKP